jgi:hypothetical protein
MRYDSLAAAALVMFCADLIAVAALVFMPKPVINVMGGFRVTDSEKLLGGVTLLVSFLGGCSLPVWLIAALVAGIVSKPAWYGPSSPQDGPARSGGGLLYLALASVGVWAVVLPFTQPEQQLRRRVERDLETGNYRRALAEMSAHPLPISRRTGSRRQTKGS